MWCRASFGIGTLVFRFPSSTLAIAPNIRDSVLSKICLYEPKALNSPLASAIGSVRTKRMLKSRQKPKFPVYNLDKKFPFHYTARVLPTVLTNPGDRDKTLGYVDKSKYKLYYENSEELKNASEDVKKIFQLENGTRRDRIDVKRAEIFRKVQKHGLDYNSEEMVIARRTAEIRSGFEKLNEKPHDKELKHRVHTLIEKRNGRLNDLRKKSEDLFNSLVQTLEIDYNRPLLAVTVYKPYRKLEIERLTNEYCERVRTEKIDAYKKALQAEKLVFDEEKKTTEEWIAQQEREILEKQQQLAEEEELFWKNKDFRKM